MASSIRRTSAKRASFNPAQTFMEHLTLKEQAATVQKRADALKKRIKEWLPTAPAAYKNETGSLFVDLDETVLVGGTAYCGMELRRNVSTTFNEETAEEILKAKGVYEEATVPVIDQEKVYRLVAEGKISESDLDNMLDEKESFAFWPVKGEVL